MATVDKNFKVKHGLIVEGTTATVNGENIITAANTTDDITEGSANLYFTDERAAAAVADEISTAVSTAVGALNTDSIPESQEPGANLYFTNERAQDAVAAALANGTHTNITVSYDDTDNAISLTGAVTYTDQDAVDAVVNGASSVDNTAYKLVQRGMDGEFSAGMITANLTGNVTGTVSSLSNHDTDDVAEGATNLYYTDERGSTAAANFIYNNFPVGPGTGINLSGYVGPTGPSEVSINRTVVDTWYDAAGAAATAESNANTYTDTAVSNLVNGAPALLDTLNELAAAINDDASFATTVATQIGGKQNTLTAGSNIDITADTISVTGLDSADISDFNTAALSATASAYDAAGAAATAEQNAKDYADLNFVTLTDLPGQLDDYVPVTEKGAALGVATLDASGYVPASQLNIDVSGDITTAINALTTDDIEEGSTNLYFTDSRAVDALEAVTPNFTEVDVNSVAKQIAATATISAGATSDSAMAYGWVKNSYTSAKFLVKVIATSSGESEMSEVLVSVDPSDNVHITEYGILSTNGALSTIGAERMGGIVMLTVSPTYNSTVKVFGTLLP